jgi:Phosphatidylinositolglycan class N (PIG-N)
MIVLTISDIMTLNFFYLVRDEGSWLDIGTSISHFTISNLLILFVIALEQLSEVLTSSALFVCCRLTWVRLLSVERLCLCLRMNQNGSNLGG